MRRVSLQGLGLLALLLLTSGCYKVALGESFQAVPQDPQRTIVYIYRERSIMGWARPLHVSVGGTERVVMVGGYAVLSLPPGNHKAFAYGTDGSQTYFTYDMGGTISSSAPITVDAKPGGSIYLRATASIESIELEQVENEEGEDEADSCDLSPGGALR